MSGITVLAGDIGGTNSRLALYRCDAKGLVRIAQATYPSSEHSCLTEIISSFLATCQARCEVACLGLPGPVGPGRDVQLTNLPWQVDREDLRRTLRTEYVELINDVEASAAGVCEASIEDFACLHPGQPDPRGNRAVISLGTGLGVAGLTPDGRAFATEAGHATFAPRNEFDRAMQRDLIREYGHVSWERVAAGPALRRIHARVAPRGAPQLDAPEIVARAASDPVCATTLSTFGRYVGAAAGNIALTLMATSGVFFCGGVAPKIVDTIGARAILDALVDKGRMRSLLERVPVYLVPDDGLALSGAAHTALRYADRMRSL